MATDPRDALVSISFRPGNISQLLQQYRAQAREIRAAALAANAEIALGMQAMALENLESKMSPRPQRETKYLVRAVERTNFIHFDERGFDFATRAFTADPAINSYWRGIEFGSTKHLGRELFGFFRGTSPGRGYAPREDRYQVDARLIQLPRLPGSTGNFPFRIVIGKPIVERKFLRDTIDAYRAGKISETYKRHLGRWMH